MRLKNKIDDNLASLKELEVGDIAIPHFTGDYWDFPSTLEDSEDGLVLKTEKGIVELCEGIGKYWTPRELKNHKFEIVKRGSELIV